MWSRVLRHILRTIGTMCRAQWSLSRSCGCSQLYLQVSRHHRNSCFAGLKRSESFKILYLCLVIIISTSSFLRAQAAQAAQPEEGKTTVSNWRSPITLVISIVHGSLLQVQSESVSTCLITNLWLKISIQHSAFASRNKSVRKILVLQLKTRAHRPFLAPAPSICWPWQMKLRGGEFLTSWWYQKNSKEMLSLWSNMVPESFFTSIFSDMI